MDKPLGVALLALGSLIFGILWIFRNIFALAVFTLLFREFPIFASLVMIGKVLYYFALGSLLIASGYWVLKLDEMGRVLAMVGGTMLFGYPFLAPVGISLLGGVVYRLSALSQSLPFVVVSVVFGLLVPVYLGRPKAGKIFTGND